MFIFENCESTLVENGIEYKLAAKEEEFFLFYKCYYKKEDKFYFIGDNTINENKYPYQGGNIIGNGSNLDPYGTEYVDEIGELVRSYKKWNK
jgi:hypothetical protein